MMKVQSSPHSLPTTDGDPLYFFGQSVMGKLAQALPWEESSLGDALNWPLELKLHLSTLFHNGQPCCLFWGEDFHFFYNDGYIPLVGESKHPHAIGKEGCEVWPEVWDQRLAGLKQVLSTGKATWNEDHLFPIKGSDGKLKNAYFTYSYSPLYLADGKINGVLITCMDTTNRFNSELELKKATLDLKSKINAIENSLNGFDIVDENGKFIYVNRSYVKMWGFDSADEVLKTSPADHCADPSIPLKIITTLKEKGKCDIEFLAKRKDGSTFDVRMLAYVAHDYEGREIYPTTSIDVTETKQAIEKFSTIANNISQLAWMADGDGHIFWYNNRWYEFTGTTFEEMEGWGWEQVQHPDEIDRVVKKWKAALASGNEWEDIFPLKGADGTYRWFLSRAMPIKDERGNIIHWFGSNTDITEQRMAQERQEELLQEIAFERSRFEIAMKQLPAAVVIAEAPSGKILFSNDKLREVWGIDLIRSENVEEYFEYVGFHPDGRRVEGHEWPLGRSIQHGEIIKDEDYEIVKGDGSRGNVRISSAPVRNKEGKIIGGIVISQDITQVRDNEMALKAALIARDEFLSIASHELKTPLTSLKLQVQLQARMQKKGLADAYSKERIESNTDKAEKLINRLDRLVDDMLDISRIRTGRLTITKEPANFYQVTKEVIDRMQGPFIAASGERIHLKASPEISARFDPMRIEQVLQNLLQNALKYGQGKQVVVSLTETESSVIVTVSDRGMGIAPEIQSKIFNRFERGISASEISGLGLGLFISREIIRAHGGEISVDSGPGEGASFTFKIPK